MLKKSELAKIIDKHSCTVTVDEAKKFVGICNEKDMMCDWTMTLPTNSHTSVRKLFKAHSEHVAEQILLALWIG